jgi:hypothetical protein
MIDETMMYEDDFAIDEDDFDKKCRYTLEKTVTPRQIAPGQPIHVCVTMTAIDEIPHVTLTDNICSKDFKIVDGSNTASKFCLYPDESLTINYSVQPIKNFIGTVDLDSRVEITYKKEKNKKTDTYTDFNDCIDVHKCHEPKKDQRFNSNCCEAKCKTVCLSSCDDSHFEKVIVDNISCNGKILRVPIILKNVCRNKSIAVAVFLREKICCNGKYSFKDMGYKVIEIPAEEKFKDDDKKCCIDNESHGCKDIKVDGICFVLPVDLCDTQNIEIHVLANYLTFKYDPIICKC